MLSNVDKKKVAKAMHCQSETPALLQRYIHSCYAPFPQMAGKVVAELFIKHVIKTQ